jgi:arsenite methyltransferase
MNTEIKGLESVKEYYGKILKTNQDLKTNACCTADSMPVYLREILKDIHEEVKDKFYGCGSPIPTALEGKTVLDLGSGSGRDCYLLSKLVGPKGKVIGVDMTDEQIAVAKAHIAYHTKKFGYSSPNIEFKTGYIEDLESVGVANASVDLVTSNCVVNLSPSKERVFREIFRVLKPGGELYFSDVFSSRRVPVHLAKDEVMIGECLGGALYTEDFRRLMFDIGCKDYRMTARSKITMNNADIQQKVGLLEFYSMTVRAFKLNLEDRCEDYGQTATYLGGITEAPNAFMLDDHHLFEKGKPMAVCGNTAMMLQNTRYGEHFRITGDMTTHFGLFDCGPSPMASGTSANLNANVGACC